VSRTEQFYSVFLTIIVPPEGLRAFVSTPKRTSTEQQRRLWSEQVLPYGLGEMMLITPSRWSLTETSRDVRLPA